MQCAPLAALDVGLNGHAVFYWSYLENGTNQPMFDLHRPIGYGQFLGAFPSGGAGWRHQHLHRRHECVELQYRWR